MSKLLNDVMYNLGRADAADLRRRSKDMDGTAITDEESKVPDFVPGKNYTSWPAGAPVRSGGQVWTLLQPYDSAAHPGNPADLRALWALCHTNNPTRAKPWATPLGTSGMYMRGECYRHSDGMVRRAKQDNTVHDADAAPQLWETVKEG